MTMTMITPTTVVKNIQETCANLGMVELSGIKLETADKSLLDVTQFSLDVHVAMQPAAIAYFGSQKKDAQRRLDAIERSYDRWQKRKYSQAKSAVEAAMGGAKGIRVGDIESRYVIDNETEIEQWEERIDQAREESDTLDVWYEAWKQKSFSIREFASIEEDERFNTNSSIGSQPDTTKEMTKIEKVRAMMQKKRLQ